jgi:hypothetical protein
MLLKCNSCQRRLPLDAYQATPDGVRGTCRPCRNAQARDRRRQRREASPAWQGYREMCGPVPNGTYPLQIDEIWCSLSYRDYRRILSGWCYDPISGAWSGCCSSCGIYQPAANYPATGAICKTCRATSARARRQGGAR